MQNMFSSGSATAEQYLQLSFNYQKSRWTLDWNTTRSVTTASKAWSPSNLRAREWENRGLYAFFVYLSVFPSVCLIVSNDIRYPAGISPLNQRQTSTLKQRWIMVGFDSWMDVEMTTLNQRWLADVESTSITWRWFNVDCLTLNQHHIISIQPSIPTIIQHSYATLMQLRTRSSN